MQIHRRRAERRGEEKKRKEKEKMRKRNFVDNCKSSNIDITSFQYKNSRKRPHVQDNLLNSPSSPVLENFDLREYFCVVASKEAGAWPRKGRSEESKT
jgi:hypothetical protein